MSSLSLASKLNVFESFLFKGQVFNLTSKAKAVLQLQPLTFSEIMWLCQFVFNVKPILKCKLELIDFIVRIARSNGVWRKKWKISGNAVKFEIVFFRRSEKKKYSGFLNKLEVKTLLALCSGLFGFQPEMLYINKDGRPRTKTKAWLSDFIIKHLQLYCISWDELKKELDN